MHIHISRQILLILNNAFHSVIQSKLVSVYNFTYNAVRVFLFAYSAETHTPANPNELWTYKPAYDRKLKEKQLRNYVINKVLCNVPCNLPQTISSVLIF